MKENKDKSVLIIDDMNTARSSLRITMTHLNFGKILCVSGVREAMEAIGSKDYDVILCDYYMGEAADGQQFLEFLRSKAVIKSSTIFVMVTAEQGYTHVMSAAECAPDDYLLKPFTAAAIQARLARLFDRNKALAEVFLLHDEEEYSGSVLACDKVIAAKTPFSIDAMRFKGEGLLNAQRWTDAIDHYEGILAVRNLPWAKLGLAKAYAGDGQMDKAEAVTRSILKDNPKYLAAYDFLANILRRTNKKKEALEVLTSASEMSTKSVSRQRVIGAVAYESGDLEASEAAMLSVIARNKNSPMREASDYTTLSNIMVEKGQAAKALGVLNEARNALKDMPDADRAVVSSVEAIAHKRNGNHPAAKRSMQEAMSIVTSNDNLSENLSMSLAKACLENEESERGLQLMKNMLQKNPDDKEMQAAIKAAMLSSGIASDMVDSIIKSNLAEVQEINNKGVLLARNGQFEEAGTLLKSAASRVPTNQQFVSNAAAIILADLEKNGFDPTKLQESQQLTKALQKLNPSHPKLQSLLVALDRISKKNHVDHEEAALE
ncbi:MAG TPA: response regulator [Methylophilaceae bacterium]|nr:response regulator [Methylophilaceae bacterium]